MNRAELTAMVRARLRRWRRRVWWGLAVGLLLVLALRHGPYAQQLTDADPTAPALTPTAHPAIPADTSQLWMVPLRAGHEERADGPLTELARGITLETQSRYAAALAILSRAVLQRTLLTDYASYYEGLAELGLKQTDRARQTFARLAARQLTGYLSEAAPLAEAEAAEQANDHGAAIAIYQHLLQQSPADPETILLRLGEAAARAGDTDEAAAAFRRVYFDYPLSDEADQAATGLAALRGVRPLPESVGCSLELMRAGTLFQAGRFKEARKAYAALLPRVAGEDRETVHLRLASCDLHLHYYRFARRDAEPLVSRGFHQAEASYDYAAALERLHDRRAYVRMVRRMEDRFGDNAWVESALNDLGTYYIVNNDDDEATAVFQEMLDRFPDGAHAERAAWKVGWAAYRQGLYVRATHVFGDAAARFPRSDYRPAYLYWAGRAYQALKNQPLADARFVLVATDYLNSYYGRRAVARLGGRDAWRRAAGEIAAHETESAAPVHRFPQALPPTGTTIKVLLAVGLYDQAMHELRYAQRVWGTSPAIEATIGWVRNREGDLRGGIDAMKRAYPQYLAAAGRQLPRAILEVLFPLDYWPLIRRYAAVHDLDPYLMAALIAQESTFEPDSRSSAHAVGLMQVLPSTGRHYARVLRVHRYSTRLLTAPAMNVRLGMAYFADLVRRFGGVHLALASYNAGESRVSRWIEARDGLDLDRDEFIEDMPYPETRDYVKRILGMADAYRWLYSGHPAAAMADSDANQRAGQRAAQNQRREGTRNTRPDHQRRRPIPYICRRPTRHHQAAHHVG